MSLNENDFRKGLIAAYLGALQMRDFDRLLSLFTPTAILTSPIKGPMPVAQTMAWLKGVMPDNLITLRDIFLTGPRNGPATALFHYLWTFPSGREVTFDCMGMFTFDETGHFIDSLRLYYDSYPLRQMLETEGEATPP